MYPESASILSTHSKSIAENVSNWVKKHHPTRTKNYDKCTRDLEYIIESLIHCLNDGNIKSIEHTSSMFFTRGRLQLKSTDVEFEAYEELLNEIEKLFNQEYAREFGICINAINKLKRNLSSVMTINLDNIPPNAYYEDRIKHVLYGWDDEKRIMQSMQQCQRNWDLSFTIRDEVVKYFLWVAQNAPSKQHEAYYDVYYSTDRETIEYLYQFSWGSTHRKNPPAMWRNSQMNANLYMIFVCKQPPTMYNCNNDGTLQDSFGESRWENSIVSVGMAMGLVMRAATKMGFKTGPNKMKDLGPDYNYEWEKRLGILDEVKAGTKRLFFGLGIGLPNEGRSRWESDDYEIAIGASNGHNCTTKYDDPDFEPINHKGQEKRKIKIVDIREHGGQVLTDPYGNKQLIPTEHEIKINTIYERDIKAIEIPKE